MLNHLQEITARQLGNTAALATHDNVVPDAAGELAAYAATNVAALAGFDQSLTAAFIDRAVGQARATAQLQAERRHERREALKNRQAGESA